MSLENSKSTHIEVNFANFPSNPSLRKKFSNYHPQRISTM